MSSEWKKSDLQSSNSNISKFSPQIFETFQPGSEFLFGPEHIILKPWIELDFWGVRPGDSRSRELPKEVDII